MKKTISVLMAVLLSLSMFGMLAVAATPTITVSSANAKAGDTVSLDVNMSGNPGINTFGLGFSYDTSRLSLTACTVNSALGGQFQYSKKAIWFNNSDVTFNGKILTLTFKVLDGASAGDASVAVTYNTGDISNLNEDDVDFTLVAGKITVGAGTPVVPPVEKDAPVFTLSSAIVKRGNEVVLTLGVDENPGFAGLTASLNYDKSVFTLINTENGNMFSSLVADKNFVWDASSNVTKKGTLATFTFKVDDNADAKDYTISVISRSCTNAELDTINPVINNATVTVIDFIYGDANDDNTVDMKDVVLLRRYLANYDYDTNTSTVSIGYGADANGDNSVDMKDVVLLRRYLAAYDYDTGTSSVVLGP